MEGKFLILSSLLLLQGLFCVKGVSLTGAGGFYPYGLPASDSILQRSTGSGPSYQTLHLVQQVLLYGTLHSSIIISSNGLLVLGSGVPAFSLEPEPFQAASRSIIAPFWASASYTSSHSGGNVYYRVSDDSDQLLRAGTEVNHAYQRAAIPLTAVSPSKLIVVTWNDLRIASDQNDGNTFQCVIVVSSSSTYVFFHYADNLVSWTGDPAALVGFNAGDGSSSFTLPTSLTAGVREIAQTGNTGRDGKWLFQVDGSGVEMPGAIIGMTETEIIVSEEPPNPNQLVSVPFCASVIRGVVNQQFSISTSVEDISTRSTDHRSAILTSLTFEALSNETQCGSIIIVQDTIYEEDEIFRIHLSKTYAMQGGLTILPSRVAITIIDTDPILVNYDSIIASEENASVKLCAKLVNPKTGSEQCGIEKDVKINYITLPGSAEEGVDYIGSNGTLTIPRNRCSKCVTVPLMDDHIFEEGESFSFTFTSNSSRIRINDTHGFANVSITDSDGYSVIMRISQRSYTVREGENISVCIEMESGEISQPLETTIKLGESPLLILQNRTTAGLDLLALHQEFTFLPGRTGETKCVTVPTYRDDIYEGTELAALILTSPSAVTIKHQEQGSLIELLDDNEVSVAIERTQYRYQEGEVPLLICANLTGEIERNFHVHVNFKEGTATAFSHSTAQGRGGDVMPIIDDIVFVVPGYSPGAIAQTVGSQMCLPCRACTHVNVVDDPFVEDKYENFSLELSNSDPAVHFTSANATVILEDNDSIRATLITTDFPSTLSENSVIVPMVSVRKEGLSNVTLSVGVVPHGITATENEDFSSNGNQVIFSGSVSNARYTEVKSNFIGLTILDDLVVEDNETLELVIETEDPQRVLIQNGLVSSVMTIIDDDHVTVSIMTPSVSVVEEEGKVEICTEMIGFTAIPLTVTVSTWSGTATDGFDFLSQSLPLPFPTTEQRILDDMYSLPVAERQLVPLPTSPLTCTNISIIDDDILELNSVKVFFANLSYSGPAVQFSLNQTAMITITDDDNVTVLVDDASRNISVTEGESVRICAQMLGRADFPISASFQPQALPGSAEGDVDFSTTEQPLDFPALSTQECVTIHTIDDSIVEGGEEFLVELAIAGHHDTRVQLGASSIVTVTIVDNDFVDVGFDAPDYSIVEGVGEVMVCAEMIGRVNIPVSVTFSVRDPAETNQGDPDYVAVSNIPLFTELSEASSRRECVNISISNDTILEDTESFEVSLASSPSSPVRITQGVSIVYIIDDDGVRIGLKERTIVVPEGGSQHIPICVEMMGRFQQSIEVVLESHPGTAHDGADYTSVLRTLTFSPARVMEQEICTNISVIDDDTFEDEESFSISLRVDIDASIHIRQTTITIQDNDQVSLSLTTNMMTVAEDVGVMEVCVELTGKTEKETPYQLMLIPLEAVNGSDFHFTAAPLSSFPPTFPDTEEVQCHEVSIEDDAILESTEHFEVTLVTPVDVVRVLVGVARMRVAITDDDTVTIGFTQEEFSVDEDGDREVEVCVQMTGEIEREVSVLISTQPGTAGVQDFDVIDETIVFSPGMPPIPIQCLTVSVRPDKLVEKTESFSLMIVSDSLGVIVHPNRLQITITDEDVVCGSLSLDTSRGYFTWPETFPEEFAAVQCENGITRRFCSRTGVWDKPVVTDCYVSTNELFRYIEKHGFTEENFKELLFAILQLLEENEEPTVKYMQIVDQIFQEFLEEVETNRKDVDKEIFGVMLEIINALQAWSHDIMKEYSSSIVESSEKISLGLFKQEDFTTLSKAQQSLSFHSNKGSVSELFPDDKPGLKYLFTRNGEGDIVIVNGDRGSDYEASIALPKSITEQLTDSSNSLEAGLFLSYYDTGILFPLEPEVNETEKEHIVTTSVVAASFAGQQINNLTDDIIIKLKLGLDIYYNVTCVSWDFEANDGNGEWVKDGCELVSVEDGEATCACNHLTNFACLVTAPVAGTNDPLTEAVHNTLSLMSVIGVCVSILGLLLTIIILLVFGKLRKKDNTKFRVQLCVALILMLVFFGIGIYQMATFQICILGSALLHYFTLVSAMWMASDALLMLLKLTKSFTHPPTCYIMIISLLCWLLPIPAVVVPIGIDRDFTISREYCFTSHSIVFFATLLGPIAALLIFILLIFLVAICITIGYSGKKYKDTEKAAARKEACHSIFSIFGIMLLFGLTWVFGAFTIRGEGPDYFKYLFVGFNSIQGLFVFIFFVVFSKETHDLWMQTCGCKRRKKRKTLTSAITGVVPPKPQRVGLDANAERLRAMEEMDLGMRLTMNSWDVMYVMPQNQFDVLLSSPSKLGGSRQQSEQPVEEEKAVGRSRLSTSSHGDGDNSQSEPSPTASPYSSPSLRPRALRPSSLQRKSQSVDYSRTFSTDSAQNAMECMSTTDSGILMDKGKSSPSLPLHGNLQSGSTPHHHVHSISGIGYVSAGSSMENLSQNEADCLANKSEPITLAPTLRPRAIPNEYARVDMDNICQ